MIADDFGSIKKALDEIKKEEAPAKDSDLSTDNLIVKGFEHPIWVWSTVGQPKDPLQPAIQPDQQADAQPSAPPSQATP